MKYKCTTMKEIELYNPSNKKTHMGNIREDPENKLPIHKFTTK